MVINFGLNEDQSNGNVPRLHFTRMIDKTEPVQLQQDFSLKN